MTYAQIKLRFGKIKRVFSSTFKSCNLNDQISFNLGRGQSRDNTSRVNCQKKEFLHRDRQLEARIL